MFKESAVNIHIDIKNQTDSGYQGIGKYHQNIELPYNVAINDNYKAKGSIEVTKIVTYVQCYYWVNPAI